MAKHRRLLIILLIPVATAVLTIAAAGWFDLVGSNLEFTSPSIRFVEVPRGVGTTPVSLLVEVRDEGAGLNELSVRAIQGSQKKELFSTTFENKKFAPVRIEFRGEESQLLEGQVQIEVRAKDSSMLGNTSLASLPLRVDYRRPKVVPLVAPTVIKAGSTQLVFYKVFDEDLGLSGVKVGTETFLGFPARSLDGDLQDSALFVAFFTVPLGESKAFPAIRLFAEDIVGNAISELLSTRVLPRAVTGRSIEVSDEYLRQFVEPLARGYLAQLTGQALFDPSTAFQFVHAQLRQFNEDQLIARLEESPRFDRYWQDFFSTPRGRERMAFGDELEFRQQSQTLTRIRNNSLIVDLPQGVSTVEAVNAGVVVLAENLGFFGRVVALDHGLGISSVYTNLESILVSRGEQVIQGQTIGTAGQSWYASNMQLQLQMRVHGTPVDPSEWVDRGWYGSQIEGRINDVKRALGLAVLQPLR
ncbi:MAG: M23 family metallopeptidase [Bdellovibrionota bacterium]|nr:MAG: M23 family metallopeptidase [Bdellovibrionota bacterium]